MAHVETVRAFERRFGKRPAVVAEAPGRVNLIGEHVDYCDGCVLPFAIAQRTVTAGARDDSGEVTVYSDVLRAESSFPVDVSAPGASGGWDNYVRGMVFGLRERGAQLGGAQLWVGGDLPPGSGMSSSAALCVATGLALAKLSGQEIALRDMALLAQQSEHDFAGTPCGIMDPFTACFGRARHALLVDCRDLSHECVPFEPDGVTILAFPSGVKHALADGAYEQRVASCKRAVAAIAADTPGLTSLRDATRALLETSKPRMDEETYRRARHVISEIGRVGAAAAALRAGDLARLGALMQETQDSLRDDYEVSCPEIDEMIGLLQSHDGVEGARMVGGGFGGVVLALVADSAADEVVDLLAARYYVPKGIPERPIEVTPAAGAAVVAVGP
jgi:galactokinase